ncbi:MAG: phosphohydrolase [Thermoleophilia bacterium]|nr:phosphohydrolase [Thermoleophilia bacterium]
MLVTRHVDLRTRGLDLGLRILLVSDIHAREDWFPRACVAKLVDEMNAVEGVDLIAMVGDFTGNDPSSIESSADEYQRLRAPVVATLGNHDHWAEPQHATAALERVGVTVLSNRALPVREIVDGYERDHHIVGIDSCWPGRRGERTHGGADVGAAMRDVPDDAEALVLGHEPHLATLHEHALHLAGHTHCGQVRSPILGDWTSRLHMPRFSEPYPCRLYELGVEPCSTALANHRTMGRRRWVYTTAGVGYSTVDFRLFCPPEIVVIDT